MTASSVVIRPHVPDVAASTRYERLLRDTCLEVGDETVTFRSGQVTAEWSLPTAANRGLPVLAGVAYVDTWRFALPNYSIPECYLVLVDRHGQALKTLCRASTAIGADASLEQLATYWPESAFLPVRAGGVWVRRVAFVDLRAFNEGIPGSVGRIRAWVGSRMFLWVFWSLLVGVLAVVGIAELL